MLAQRGASRLMEECAEDEAKDKKAAREHFGAVCACKRFPEDPAR